MEDNQIGHGGQQQRQLRCGDVAERAHGPDDEALERLLGAEVLQYLHYGAHARAHHYTEDEYHHYVLYAGAYCGDKGECGGGTDPCGACHAERREPCMPRKAQHRGPEYEERHAEACSRAYAQHVWAGQRVAEERLHLQAAHGERGPRDECHDGLHEAYVTYDSGGCGVALAARKRCPHISYGYRYRPYGYVGGKEYRYGCREEDKEYRGARFHPLRAIRCVCSSRVGRR